jgi:hypothetical protein
MICDSRPAFVRLRGDRHHATRLGAGHSADAAELQADGDYRISPPLVSPEAQRDGGIASAVMLHSVTDFRRQPHRATSLLMPATRGPVRGQAVGYLSTR